MFVLNNVALFLFFFFRLKQMVNNIEGIWEKNGNREAHHSSRIPGGFDRKVNLQLRGVTVFCTCTVTVGSRVETHFVLPTPYALSSP